MSRFVSQSVSQSVHAFLFFKTHLSPLLDHLGTLNLHERKKWSQPKKKATSKNEDVLKDEDNLKNENDLKNKDDFKKEDSLKDDENLILKTVPSPSLYNLSCAC